MLRKSILHIRIIALFCAVALLVSGIPITSVTASSIDSSDSTSTSKVDFSLDFEHEYKYSNGDIYYSQSSAENWSANNARGSHAKMITENDGNQAIRLTYDTQWSENYNANAVMNIYDPETMSKFIGDTGKKYIIRFSYKIEETDGQQMQFYLASSNRCGGSNSSDKNTRAAFANTDMGPKAVVNNSTTSFTAITDIITEVTDGYVTASVIYTAQGPLESNGNSFDSYPIIILQTNNKSEDETNTGDRPFASALIDNISITDYYTEYLLDFEKEYTDTSDETYYSSATAENWSANNARGSHAEMITENDGNQAVRLTYDTQNSNENYNANAVMNIYDPETKSKFIGETGKKYLITFSYKIEETDGKRMQLYLAPSNRCGGSNSSDNNTRAAFANTDMGPKAVVNNSTTSFTAITDAITETTDGYVTTSVIYTAQGHLTSNGKTFASYPIIILQTNGKTKDATHTGNRAYASVLIDNITVSEVKFIDYTLDFEEEYKDSLDAVYYDSSISVNMTSDSTRASHTEIVTEEDGNNAMRLTYDTGREENYKDNAAINIYEPNTKTKFSGTAGEQYTITFSYKVENTDGYEMQLYLVNCGRSHMHDTDCNLNNAAMQATEFNYIPLTDKLTQETDGYITVSEQFIANGLDYPIIVLSTNNSTTVSNHTETNFASLLIDNISVKKDKQLYTMCYGYNGVDTLIKIYDTTVFGDLSVPSRAGYLFDGWYKDAEYSQKAANNELVSECKEIYAKWLGDGNSMTPTQITDAIIIDTVKGIKKSDISADFTDISYVQNSMLEQVASATVTSSDSTAWYGAYVISGEDTVLDTNQVFSISNIDLKINPNANSVIFYAELPEFVKSGADWALAISNLSVVQNGATYKAALIGDENTFSYLAEGSDEWIAANIKSDGVLSLPSSFKGYIRLDFSAISFDGDVDLTAEYTLNTMSLALNSVGGECGDFLFGGIFYAPANNSNSTVMKVADISYELSRSSNAVIVNPNSADNSKDGVFSVRYSGTAGVPDSKIVETESSAYWAETPIAITSSSGNTLTTTGYMNTYRISSMRLLMQPSVDSFMIYVEVPEYTSNLCAVKILEPVIMQSQLERTINFSNSIYQYLDINDGAWKIARAGSDGELNAITSGFKGYIKFDIKQMKNFIDITGIDFTKPYYLDGIEIAFNHIGGKNGNLVIGAFYSIIKNSDSTILQNGITHQTLCANILGGDISLDGKFSADDLTYMRKALIGFELDTVKKLRVNSDENPEFDIRDLVRLKKIILGTNEPIVGDKSNGVTYKEIFTPDVTTTNSAIVYGRNAVTNYSKIIDADTTLNSEQKAIDFANEINSSKIADFEKTGIDKMCHVSTFVYANDNIYMSYYANTQSAVENPSYQVARLAYCSEPDPEDKVIIDIQAVGDDLYGQKVVGVYDTILMQKQGDDTNLYILWTANINGQYYRLYRTFNMLTEELGEINVNRFKVGNTVNDFSTSGIKNALTSNDIGYKYMFADIGIMQKLSTRVENGETYYYTGAYSGEFTCIIKSKDLVTWEYVAQPNIGENGTGFENQTKWENAVYVVDDKCYYFVRQWDPEYDSEGNLTVGTPYDILTYYDLNTGEWETPVLVGDSQSRSDFIMYNGELYLFHAPTDRNHIGILKIDTEDLTKTRVVLQADMRGSCFYPFVQYNSAGELCMSYTVNRTNIRLAKFTLSKYLN